MNQAEQLVAYARAYIGIPYKWGGNHPAEGLDCSGLCCILLRRQGVLAWNEDLTAREILKRLKSRSHGTEIRAGAFLFFGRDEITHIALAVSETHLIEAGGGGSDTTTLERAIERRAFVREMPINYRSDFKEAVFII